MISKAKISEIRKLHLKKFRDQERRFLVEGRKSVEMLLQADFQIEEIFATEDFLQEHPSFRLCCSITTITSSEMERISTLSTAPELLAVVLQPDKALSIDDNEPVVVLDRIADPGNMGTIIRTADWFGIRHIFCSLDSVEFYNPKTIQSTMGSFAHVTLHRGDVLEFLKKQSKRRILGTFLHGESVNTFSFQGNDIIMIGNESNGISEAVSGLVTHKLTIPRGRASVSKAESLNAAIAAAIVLERWASR